MENNIKEKYKKIYKKKYIKINILKTSKLPKKPKNIKNIQII